jgi:hypothetical protein
MTGASADAARRFIVVAAIAAVVAPTMRERRETRGASVFLLGGMGFFSGCLDALDYLKPV